jgi:hypothetical protein
MSTGWFWFAFTKQSLLILLSLASLESVCAHKLLACMEVGQQKNMALALEELDISIPVDRPGHCIWMHLVSIWVRRPTIWSLKVLRVAPSARCCCCNYPFFCLDLFLPGGHDPSVCFLRGAAAKIARLRLFPLSQSEIQPPDQGATPPRPWILCAWSKPRWGTVARGLTSWAGQRSNMGFAPYYMIQVLPC